MRHIDLNLLGHLAVLLQTRSVSQAALRLGMSQPAMSRSLAELRTLFGDPLLVRTRNGMLPTRRAEELGGPLQQWLAEANSMVLPEAFDPARLVRRFRIGAGAYGVRAVIAPTLTSLLEAAPGIAIDVIADGGDTRARLASGEADLVIADARPDPQLLHDRLLLAEGYACVVRDGHPLLTLAEARPPSLDDVGRWPHIAIGAGEEACDPLARALEATVGRRWPVASLPFAEAAVALVAESDAVLLLPETAARRVASCGLGLIPAPDELGTFELRALWHNRNHHDPALHWLVERLARRCQIPGAAGVYPHATVAILEAAE
jgi:DNA-binding transcriptional LysR family regulator